MSSDVYAAMRAIEGRAVEVLSREVLDQAPVLDITQSRPLPVHYWANRLYGDALRTEELVSRNDVWHPLFMPLEFEALSR